jgi:hypothetical protein
VGGSEVLEVAELLVGMASPCGTRGITLREAAVAEGSMLAAGLSFGSLAVAVLGVSAECRRYVPDVLRQIACEDLVEPLWLGYF